MDEAVTVYCIQPPVFTAVRYINEVLRPCVIPVRRRIGRNFILMQDNALPHVAKVTREYLAVMLMLMLVVFVKNARITSKWHYSIKKNRRDSNFFSNCLLKSTFYDGLCSIFEKKSEQSR